MALANLELRVPIIRQLVVGNTLGLPPVEGFVFADAGMAWGKIEVNPGQVMETRANFRRGLQSATSGERGIVTSAGVGARVNLFGYFVVEGVYVKAFERTRAGTGSSRCSPGSDGGRRYEGTKVRRYEGTKVRRCGSAKAALPHFRVPGAPPRGQGAGAATALRCARTPHPRPLSRKRRGRGVARPHAPARSDDSAAAPGLEPQKRTADVCDVYTLSRLRERVRAYASG